MPHTMKNQLKLGFGLMRLPRKADGSIDVDLTAALADRFIEGGGTYFDTTNRKVHTPPAAKAQAQAGEAGKGARRIAVAISLLPYRREASGGHAAHGVLGRHA